MTDKEAEDREKQWTEQITGAVTEQTWSSALRKMANVSIIIAVVAVSTIMYACMTVSPKAGCITSCFIFLSMAVATEILARVSNHKNAVLDAAQRMTDSLRPPS